MIGGDAETVSLEDATFLAEEMLAQHMRHIEYGLSQSIGRIDSMNRRSRRNSFLLSGSGEFIAREVFVRGYEIRRERVSLDSVHSLGDQLGPEVSACAAAYAVAVLAADQEAPVHL